MTNAKGKIIEFPATLKKENTKPSKVQARFNNLSKKINQLKYQIDELFEKEQIIREVFEKEMKSIIEEYYIITQSNIILMDQLSENGKLSKKRKEILKENIVNECYVLKNFFLEDDTKLELVNSVLSKHDENSDERELEQMLEVVDLVKQRFGVDLSDILTENDNVDDFINKSLEKIESTFNASNDDNTKKGKNQLLAKDHSQESKDPELTIDFYLSIFQELYPERENDDASRLKKEELIKKMNNAYQSQDISKMLFFEINFLSYIEQHVRTFPDKVIKKYNNLITDLLESSSMTYQVLLMRPIEGVSYQYTQLLKCNKSELSFALEAEVERLKESVDDAKVFNEILSDRKALLKYLDLYSE